MSHKHALMELLLKIDKAIPAESRITLVGVGDTALALLDLKAQTVHLDFTGDDKDIADFSRICTNIQTPGFQVHTWNSGMVFGQQLPKDYLKASLPVNAGLARIDLRALHPLDIVVTRIERLRETDMRDIKACIKQFKLGKNQISKRAKALQRVGDEARFERNLDYVLGLFEQAR
ncbi:MAG: DUF6036 family nucleotidyltransferase [Nitrososphaera sp.]